MWFSIEKIDKNTFAISEYKHYEKVHSYLLIGDKKALLIDTGLGIENIKKEVDKLTDKEVIVASTHVHWDHIGGHKYFNNILVHELEKNWLLDFPLPINIVRRNVYDKNLKLDVSNYQVYNKGANKIIKSNEIIDLGNRKIKAIHTPGHSPGHLCFYDLENKYLFSGDLIYKGKIDLFYETTNPIDYMESIKKISKIKINKILPGHFDLNIDNKIVKKILEEILLLERKEKLIHGSGIHVYKDFTIHL